VIVEKATRGRVRTPKLARNRAAVRRRNFARSALGVRCVLASLSSRNARKSGDGSGAHVPDEYYIIESAIRKSKTSTATMSFVEYLYQLAK